MLLLARSVSLSLTRRLYNPTLSQLSAKINEDSISSKYEAALRKFEGRIAFNSVLEIQSVRIKKYDKLIKTQHQRKKLQNLQHEVKSIPAVLSQLCENVTTFDQTEEVEEEEVNSAQDLPFSRFLKVGASVGDEPEENKNKVPKNWLQDYELYNEADEDLQSTYGTPDPKTPVSKIPCSGCGALLHCKEGSIPGYVPSELFRGLSDNELKTIHCQRCHFLVNYNTAINVTVTPQDYINIISTIKGNHALAVILVDLLDFPCSIFSGLKDILGANRPVFIVGNKVDLLPRDQPDYLNHIKRCLKAEATKMGFEEKYIKHISLISAKTGYGIEELITKLHGIWNYRGDVYLVGCTNVGKSSLFNALLRSDFCKVEASDLVQRATACPWPGTTLRMLKFPILKTSDIRIAMRTQRLIQSQKRRHEEDQLRRDQARKTKDVKYATLIGHIGMTFTKDKPEVRDPTAQSHEGGFAGNIFTLNEKSEKYALSKWCYDTPGVIQKDQILHLLTTDEIIKTTPKEMIRPRAFIMKEGLSLFLGGLGRLDYLEGPESIQVVVYSSLDLPVSICEIEDAEEFYDSFLGSEILGVPINSGEERMAKWPRLEAEHDKIVIEGEEKHISVCDILLSSAGWIGINLPNGQTGTFKAWTPEKRGIYVRKPALMRYGMSLRGKKVRRSLAYLIGNAFTYEKAQ